MYQLKTSLYALIIAIWSTRHTQELVDNETKAKTVLRELIIYLIFLVILCASKFVMESCRVVNVSDNR